VLAAAAVAAAAVVVATDEQRECWTGGGRLDSGGDGHGLTTLECRSAAVAAERQYSSVLLIFLILAAGCLDVNGSAAVLQLMVNLITDSFRIFYTALLLLLTIGLLITVNKLASSSMFITCKII